MDTMRLLAVVVGMLVAFGAASQTEKVSRILSQQREIRQQAESSTGAYARFDRSALQRIEAAQGRVFTLLDGVTDVDQMTPHQRIELFNALEEVKAVIESNEDDRQECWRERKLGSMRHITRCATVAERRQARDGGRAWLGDPSVCIPVGGGPACGRMPDPTGVQ
jgi:hypothetical protein